MGWDDPGSNPMRDLQEWITHAASEELRRQNLMIEVMLGQAMMLYDEMWDVEYLHTVFQDGCNPSVATMLVGRRSL